MSRLFALGERVVRLQDRVAIITGGGRGLGKAIALRFAREGSDLVLAAPEQDEIEATAAEIAATQRRVIPVVTDITREDQIAAMVTRAREEFGRIDILVNNSGIMGPTAAVTDVRREDWEEVLAINLTGAYLVSKAVLPEMIAARRGKVINISSIAGRIGYPLRSPYAVSKWGLIGLTMTMAVEYGEHNIQVNAICPGPVEGPRIQRVFEGRAAELGRSVEAVKQEYVDKAVLRRLVQGEDIAAMATFLASEESSNITGQALDVSAGYGL